MGRNTHNSSQCPSPRKKHCIWAGLAVFAQAAIKHLLDKERDKLTRDGAGDRHTHSALTGEEILRQLFENNEKY